MNVVHLVFNYIVRQSLEYQVTGYDGGQLSTTPPDSVCPGSSVWL